MALVDDFYVARIYVNLDTTVKKFKLLYSTDIEGQYWREYQELQEWREVCEVSRKQVHSIFLKQNKTENLIFCNKKLALASFKTKQNCSYQGKTLNGPTR